MTTGFITRHPGARHWAEAQQLAIDRYCTHLDPAEIAAGDTEQDVAVGRGCYYGIGYG